MHLKELLSEQKTASSAARRKATLRFLAAPFRGIALLRKKGEEEGEEKEEDEEE